MANWNLPTLSDLYANFLQYLSDRLDDAAMMLDSSLTTPTNPKTGFKRWNATLSRFEKWNGSAWVDLTATYGISISGSSGSCTGNALTATTATSATSATSATTSTTQAVDDNSTNIATTAWYNGQKATASPAMNGTAAAGTSLRFARGDHVHPSDTTKQATLVSGSNIRTVNGNTLLGNTDIVIPTGWGPARIVTLTYGTTYTPPADVKSMRVFVGGASGGSAYPTIQYATAGGGGGGYSEKYYATVSGSYSYAIGAGGGLGGAGGTTTFGVMTVTGGGGGTLYSAGGAGGVGSGGDYNRTGGAGGSGVSIGDGETVMGSAAGGGAGAGRAGNGYAGGACYFNYGGGYGGGGGTGGVGGAASNGYIPGAPGIAATTLSATPITAFDDAVARVSFKAGNSSKGASGEERGGVLYTGGGAGGGSSAIGDPGSIVIWEYI